MVVLVMTALARVSGQRMDQWMNLYRASRSRKMLALE